MGLCNPSPVTQARHQFFTGNWKPGGRESHPHHLLLRKSKKPH